MLHDHTFGSPASMRLEKVEGDDEFGDCANSVLGELCRVCFRIDAAGLVDVALGGVGGWVAQSRFDLAEEIACGADVFCELAAAELRACVRGSARAVVQEDVDKV